MDPVLFASVMIPVFFGPVGLFILLVNLIDLVEWSRMTPLDLIQVFALLLVHAGAVFLWYKVSSLISKAAAKKGRSKRAFFWLSFLLWPLGAIVMGIITASVAGRPAPDEN